MIDCLSWSLEGSTPNGVAAAFAILIATHKTGRTGFSRAFGPLTEIALPSQGMMLMPENTTSAATPKAKPKPVTVAAPAFDMPKFEMPKFEVPKFEVPVAFREFAEKGITQAKENYEKMKTAAEKATDVLEETYSTASKGYAGYGLKVIETARANSDAAFDLMTELMTAKSYAEFVELSSAYLRKQFDALTSQSKELYEHAQKVANDTVEPIKESISNNFSKAA